MKQAVISSVQTRSMRKAKVSGAVSNSAKEKENDDMVEVRKNASKLRSNNVKVGVSKISSGIEKATDVKHLKAPRPKSVQPGKVEHTTTFNTTREKRTSTTKIITGKSSASVDPSTDNTAKVRKGTRKLKSNNIEVDVSKISLGIEKASDVKHSKAPRSKSVQPAMMEHPTTSNTTRERGTSTTKIITKKRSASVDPSTDNTVEVRKRTRKLRSNNIEVDVSEVSFGIDKATYVKHSRSTRSKSVQPAMMKHTTTSNTTSEKRTLTTKIITRKRSASVDPSADNTVKVHKSTRKLRSNNNEVDVPEVSLGIDKATDVKHSQAPRSKSVQPAMMEHTTTSNMTREKRTSTTKIITRKMSATGTKGSEEKATSSKGVRNKRLTSIDEFKKQILRGESSFNTNPSRALRSLQPITSTVMEHTTSNMTKSKIKKAKSISKIAPQTSLMRTERKKGTSNKSNENIQQQLDQKLHTEQSIDNECSLSIIGSPVGQSTPVEQTSKNINPPTNDILRVTQSNNIKYGIKTNERKSLPAARFSMCNGFNEKSS